MRSSFAGAIWGGVASAVVIAGLSLATEQPAGREPPAPPQLSVTEVAPLTRNQARERPANPETGLAYLPIAPEFPAIDAAPASTNVAGALLGRPPFLLFTAKIDPPAQLASPSVGIDLVLPVTRLGSVMMPEAASGTGARPNAGRLLDTPLVPDLIRETLATPREFAPIGETGLQGVTARVVQMPVKQAPPSVDQPMLGTLGGLLPSLGAPDRARQQDLPQLAEPQNLRPNDPAMISLPDVTETAPSASTFATVRAPAKVDTTSPQIGPPPVAVAQRVQPAPSPTGPVIQARPRVRVVRSDETGASAAPTPAPTGTLGIVTETIPVLRLGEASSTSIDDATPEALEDAALEEPADESALALYGAIYEGDVDAPKAVIALMDTPRGPALVDELAEIGFAPLIILDPLQSNVLSRATTYQEAGAEIAVELFLPRRATFADVDVSFQVSVGALPQSLALFFNGRGPLQSNRELAAALMPSLAERGMGLVAVQSGFGTTLRIAEDAGVPNLAVTRSMIGDHDNPVGMRRAIDGVALRARQTGQAVLLAELRPEVLEVLADWARDLRTDPLELAPLSAIMLPTPELDPEGAEGEGAE